MGGRRMLLVHAHPDDESINNGATMARYVADGAAVTLVTCTLGELGEIIPPELAVLAADQADALGTYRIGELALACAALGVTDHRFLGGPGRWRDSGMMGMPDNDAPGAFWRAEPGAAAEALTSVIREVRPQVVVSYDANGGYGHPDHIQAHRVTGRAFERAADLAFGTGEPYRPAKLYAAASPHPELRGHLTTRIDATAHFDAKRDAMRAHATQITVRDDVYALSNDIDRELTAVEYYSLLSGTLGPVDADGYETDLFAGIA